MKKLMILFATIFLLSLSSFAQTDDKLENIEYSNITEAGWFTGSFKSSALEITTVNGFTLDPKNHFGLGIGIGTCNINTTERNFYEDEYYGGLIFAYSPIFFNFRHYFSPEKYFSPQINIAVGGLFTNDGGGFYSSITGGFKGGAFSFSSGFSLMIVNYDDKTLTPFGFVLKIGFAF